MKTLLTTAVLVLLSFTITNCSSDDDNTNENPIIGTWRLDSQNFDGNPVTLNNCDLQFTVIYTATEFTSTDYNTDNSGSCIINDTSVSLYRIEGDRILFTDNNGTITEPEAQTVFAINNDRLTVTVSRPNDPDDQIDINTFVKVTGK